MRHPFTAPDTVGRMEPSDATPRELFRIGQVAERLRLSLRTVRYYEEMGLVHPETRTEGGFRLYSEREIDRLKLIKQMKPLGFTVAEMRELLDARDTLRSGEGDEAASKAARDLLATYARAAADRCDELRMQLAGAESLAGQLSREGQRSRGAMPVS